MAIGKLTWRKVSKLAVITLVVGYVLACATVWAFQRSLLYFPTAFTVAVAESIGSKEGLLPWRNSRGELIGWKLPAKTNSSGQILILHGNAGSAVQRGYLAHPAYEATACDVFLLEYPGYGARPGTPSMGSFLAAADEAFKELAQKPVYVVSESIGTGAAAHLAKSYPDKVHGMLMFVPYDDLASVAQRQMWWLPASMLLKDRYQPAKWLNDYRGPVKVVLAGEDEIVPVELGRNLFESYQGPKQLQIIPNARHNDPTSQPIDWWKGVVQFWKTNRLNRAVPSPQNASP
ncbi:MAG: alpha/beta hydrolase [Verrucomicrobia bacterium]|nr:alpha/beta hydrolase [Verrucomicrobiota bacterium]